MKPEAALERARRALLLRVRADQRGVDVDHDPPRPGARLPGVLTRPRTSGAQRVEQARVSSDPIDHPERRRVRGDRPEQHLLVTDCAQVGQTVAAIGQHHCQVPDHAARIVPAAPLAHARQRPRERVGEPEPIRALGQQRGAGMRDQPVSVRRNIYGETAPIALHLQGDPPEPGLCASATRRIPAQADSPAAPTTGAATAS
jgi:hypothetical protein